jgi:glutaredoxin 2
MASTVSKKRVRSMKAGRERIPKHPSLDAAQMKELMKQAVREVLDERAEQEAEAWDRQIEADSNAGRLDRLADQALADFEQGRATKL